MRVASRAVSCTLCARENSCFYRHHYDEKQVDAPIEYAKHSDIVRAHTKYEASVSSLEVLQ